MLQQVDAVPLPEKEINGVRTAHERRVFSAADKVGACFALERAAPLSKKERGSVLKGFEKRGYRPTSLSMWRGVYRKANEEAAAAGHAPPPAEEIFPDKRARPRSVNEQRSKDVVDQVASSIRPGPNGEQPKTLSRKDVNGLFREAARLSAQDRTDCPLAPWDELSRTTLNKLLKENSLSSVLAQMDTAARNKARHDVFNFASLVAMLNRVLHDETLAALSSNVDAVTAHLHTEARDSNRIIAPKGADVSQAKRTGNMDNAFSCKQNYQMAADGQVLSVVVFMGDSTMPPNGWVRMPLMGLGPSIGYTGHLVIAHSSSPNEEQNCDLVENVYAPALLARRDVCLQHLRLPNKPGRILLALDGESQQLSAVASNDVKATLNAAGITAVKHPASLTGEVQLNDLTTSRRTIHTLVKSGSAGLADQFWVADASSKVLTACDLASTSGTDDDE